MKKPSSKLMMLGWREWVSLPELGIDRIKAKVDTGARTSALHAFEVTPFDADGKQFVRFMMHPLQRDRDTVVACTAEVVDRRRVRDSGGHSEIRWVITTRVKLGPHAWDMEATLTERDNMLFRMLLGRTALKHRFAVNPARSYLVGKPGPGPQ